MNRGQKMRAVGLPKGRPPKKRKGWRNESRRHSLASRGIKTANKLPATVKINKSVDKEQKYTTINVSPEEQVRLFGRFIGMLYKKSDGTEIIHVGESVAYKTKIKDKYVVMIQEKKQYMKPHGIVTEYINKKEKGFNNYKEALNYTKKYMKM